MTRPRQVRSDLDPSSAGPPDAPEALVRRHGPVVLLLCRRLDPDPDDAFQEIWAKVFGALERFDPAGPASLRTWIKRIAHRHLVDRYRRRRTRGTSADVREIPPIDPTIEERLTTEQRRARLHAALTHLDDPSRRVVVLHHLEGVSVADIAELEGSPVGTIKARLHRARARLMTWLAEGAP